MKPVVRVLFIGGLIGLGILAGRHYIEEAQTSKHLALELAEELRQKQAQLQATELELQSAKQRKSVELKSLENLNAELESETQKLATNKSQLRRLENLGIARKDLPLLQDKAQMQKETITELEGQLQALRSKEAPLSNGARLSKEDQIARQQAVRMNRDSSERLGNQLRENQAALRDLNARINLLKKQRSDPSAASQIQDLSRQIQGRRAQNQEIKIQRQALSVQGGANRENLVANAQLKREQLRLSQEQVRGRLEQERQYLKSLEEQIQEAQGIRTEQSREREKLAVAVRDSESKIQALRREIESQPK